VIPEPARVAIAHITRARGNKGEFAAIPLSDNPERVRRVFVNGTAYDVESAWRHADHVIFKLQGIDSIDAAEKLAGADVEIPMEERATLAEGEYFQTDLVGCAVVMRDGRRVGVVTGWQEYGGPPLLEVDSNGAEVLIPFAKSICVEIDVPQRRIVIDPPDGLL